MAVASDRSYTLVHMFRELRRRTYRLRRVRHEVVLALRRPFRVIGAATLLAIVGVGIAVISSAPLTERMGGSVGLGPDSTAVLDVSDHGDLALAGVETGDRLLALDGEPVTPSRAALLVGSEVFEGPTGDPLTLRLEREGQVWDTVAVFGAREIEQARSLGLSHRAVQGVSQGLLGLVMAAFALAGLVLLIRSRARGYSASLATALLTAAGAFAYIAIITRMGQAPGTSVMLGAVAGTFAFLAALPAVCAALVRFPDGRHTPRWTRHARSIGVAGVGLILVIIVVNVFLEGPDRDTGRAPFVAVFSVVAGLILLPTVGLVQKYRRGADPVVRQQMKWVLLPLGAFAVATIANGAVGEVHALQAHATPAGYLFHAVTMVLGWLTAAAIPVGVLAGLYRFRPWDADLWIARSAAVGAGTLGLAAVFAGGAEAIRLGLRSSFGEGADPIAAALAAVVSLFAFNPVREWVTRRLESDLERTREILGERLPLVLAGRQVVASPGEIGRVAIRALRDALQTDRAAVIDLDPDGWKVVATEGTDPADALAWAEDALDSASLPACAEQVWEDPRFVLRVPLRSAEDEVVGVLALGTHGKGRGYSTEERRAVDGVSRPLAEALRVAERREEAEARDRARLAQLVDRFLVAPAGDGHVGPSVAE